MKPKRELLSLLGAISAVIAYTILIVYLIVQIIEASLKGI
jgi:hypothetical protein